MNFEIFLILFLISLPVVVFFQIRKNQKDETKEKNYFAYFWVEQRMLGKEEYRSEVILGTILLFLTVPFLIYAVLIMLREGGISDPSHPLVFYMGWFITITGLFYIIRAYLVRRRARAFDQSVDGDAKTLSKSDKSAMISSLLWGIAFTLFGVLLLTGEFWGCHGDMSGQQHCHKLCLSADQSHCAEPTELFGDYAPGHIH